MHEDLFLLRQLPTLPYLQSAPAESDIVCFTETQLSPDHDTTDICNKLPFHIEFNNSNNKFQSIAYGVKDFDYYRGCDISRPGVSVIMIEKDTFSDNEIWIGILYKLHSQPVQEFYDQLRNLVDSSNVHILLGDFNIDYPVTKHIFDEVLSDYHMVVYDPTHIDGSLLDHVYVKRDWAEQFNEIATLIKCIFFSDHDVVKIKITQ